MNRSEVMRAVKSANTTPEILVRRIAHSLGFRFRLHRRELPGNPDLVFPRLSKVVFVHGCFWHGHACARGARVPKANRAYWVAKVARNRARDKRVRRELASLGWKSLVVWECELRAQQKVARRLARFLTREG
jgi:DNA mismatch endonuclease (patch repair protein)